MVPRITLLFGSVFFVFWSVLMKKKCMTVKDFFKFFYGMDDANFDYFTHEDLNYVYGDLKQIAINDDAIRMLYDGTVVSVIDSKCEIAFYKNPLVFNTSINKCKKVKADEDISITINDIDIDDLSIYELEHLLSLLKRAQHETEVRIVAKKLRKKGVISRGRKRALLRKIKEEENNYD